MKSDRAVGINIYIKKIMSQQVYFNRNLIKFMAGDVILRKVFESTFGIIIF